MIQYSAALIVDPHLRDVLDGPLRGHDDTAPRPAYATSESFGMLATTDWLRPFALAA